MPIGLLGTKIGMTQLFNEKGSAIPVTILKAGPCIITQIKTKEINGYEAIQIGYKPIKANKLTKAQIGHLDKSDIKPVKYLREYKCDTPTINKVQIGEILNVESFKIGNFINISGHSIGKGFSGYQKRHHFSRGPMSHGSKNHRQPGSIGAGTTPGRVFPGKKMAGRMGFKKVTIKNLQIIDIHSENNILIVKGAVPGKAGNLVYIHNT
uniref:Large ribosomal subunit protein uL3c n=1 Tax=Antithamnionella ternifolia TaxID=207919 RepID=A0A4D6WNC3_9FLOR|nr:ribosomal protein L3 [Antithamnionella ternifolia]